MGRVDSALITCNALSVHRGHTHRTPGPLSCRESCRAFRHWHSCAPQKAVGVLWASLRFRGSEETHAYGYGYGYGYGYVKDGWMDGWMVAGKVTLVSRSGLAANGRWIESNRGLCAHRTRLASPAILRQTYPNPALRETHLVSGDLATLCTMHEGTTIAQRIMITANSCPVPSDSRSSICPVCESLVS